MVDFYIGEYIIAIIAKYTFSKFYLRSDTLWRSKIRNLEKNC